MYKFVRINEGDLRGSYHHPLFIRGRLDLINLINRQDPKDDQLAAARASADSPARNVRGGSKNCSPNGHEATEQRGIAASVDEPDDPSLSRIAIDGGGSGDFDELVGLSAGTSIRKVVLDQQVDESSLRTVAKLRTAASVAADDCTTGISAAQKTSFTVMNAAVEASVPFCRLDDEKYSLSVPAIPIDHGRLNHLQPKDRSSMFQAAANISSDIVDEIIKTFRRDKLAKSRRQD